jgi:hypothetical protein
MKKMNLRVAALAACAALMAAGCGGTKSAVSSAAGDAEKEAKRLEKEGWQTAPGGIPMVRQLEYFYTLQYERDEATKQPKYITGDAMSVGESYDAAKMQALEVAKLQLAGKIETTVMAIVQSDVANEQLANEQAASITKSVAANKSVIAQKLGRSIPLVELYRSLPNKNKVVRVILGYDQASALSAAKEAVREDLEKKGEQLQGQLDNLFKLK